MTIRVALRDAQGRPLLAWGSDVERMRAAGNGFQVVALMASGIQDPSRRLEAQGLRVIRCGYEDNRDLAQAQAAVLRCAPAIASAVAAGKRTLVLCAAGENRSGLATARALWLLTGEPGQEIVRKMRAIAKLTCPADPDNCTFTNGLFRRWAESWPATAPQEEEGTVFPLVVKIAVGALTLGTALWAWRRWRGKVGVTTRTSPSWREGEGS